MIAKVEPLTPARVLRGPFDYRLSAELGAVDVGSMLVIPFGRRRQLGVVVDLAERSELPPQRLLEPLAALEADAPAELIELGLWVAREYCSTPARGLALVLPPGTGIGSGPRVSVRRVLVARLTRAGRAALEDGRRLGARQRAALEGLCERSRPAASLSRAAGCGHGTLRRLEALGLVALEPIEQESRPRTHSGPAPGPSARDRPRLTSGQEEALAEIVAAMDAGEVATNSRDAAVDGFGGAPSPLLLHGVTGSGKTEVYLRAVEAALERGRTAIVLVPEIALTPQTAGRFEDRFGDRVALLHSGLSARERYDEWTRLRRGRARVCVGPRSAVFAPLEDLGLIVVDEEHDGSYKQEGDPRYDARRVAQRRAAGAGAVLVAGSATPRPESFARHRRVVLPQRVDGRALPVVELVGGAGAPGGIHERTRELLDGVRGRAEKAIVLLNRRGWSNFLSCRECGRVWDCPGCDVSLVLHRDAGRVACHHCGHSEPVPATCPDCGSISVARHGAGTERLERELGEIVAPLPVFRLDSDTVASRQDAAAGRGAAEILSRFEAAPAGVLVGTQMVAKGHDFPAVTLGVVLDADATLRFPDFRAEERTFALVAQLAGRAGRGRRGGRVVVQALDPSARPLAFAVRHDAGGFLAGELERREALGYPPFGDLIRVVCSAPEAGPESEAAAGVLARIDAAGCAETAVLGPAPLFRRRGRCRAQLVVKTRARADALVAVRGAVEAVAGAREHRGVSFAVDVDPQ